MVFQPTNIIPDEVNGTGCVDFNDGLRISWQVNGDSPVTAIQVFFYQNDESSTPVGHTSKQMLSTPFWGRDASGNVVRAWVSWLPSTVAAMGLTNGNEYKFVLVQYWGENAEYEVRQLTASVFYGRTAPTLTIDAIDDPLTSREHTFTATYSQEQGDAINSIEWFIAEEGYENDPLVNTGKIYGTGILEVSYDGFFTGVRYGVRCIVTTQSTQVADTGWQYFDVEYSVDEPTGEATACQLANENAIFVQWTQMDDARGYSVMRQKVGEHRLKKIVDANGSVGQIRDYSAKSGETYIYYIFPSGDTTYLTSPQVTAEVTAKYLFWGILEAEQDDDGKYIVMGSYYFRIGEGGVKEGDISNNNLPTILKNFTRYPIRQKTSSNYRTGSVSGYIGSISRSTRTYSDTVDETEAIMELSTTEHHLFLSDPKGHFMVIQSNGEITAKTDVKKHIMPQTITFPWIEVASSEDVMVVSEPGHDFYPSDEIVYTQVGVSTTGALIWIIPDDYQYGSQLSIVDGALIQTTSGSYTEATLEISEGSLIATTSDT